MDSDEEIWSYTTKKKRKNTKKDEGGKSNESKRCRLTQIRTAVELENSIKSPLNKNVKENRGKKMKNFSLKGSHLHPEKPQALPKIANSRKEKESFNQIDLVDLTFFGNDQELVKSKQPANLSFLFQEDVQEVSSPHSDNHLHQAEEILPPNTVEVETNKSFDEADIFDLTFSEIDEEVSKLEHKASHVSPHSENVQTSHIQQVTSANSPQKSSKDTEQPEENDLFSQGDLFDRTFSENDHNLLESKPTEKHSSTPSRNSENINNFSSGDYLCPGQVLRGSRGDTNENMYFDDDDHIDLTLSENDDELLEPQAKYSSSPLEDGKRNNVSEVNNAPSDSHLGSAETSLERRDEVEEREDFDKPDPIDLTFSENYEKLVEPEPPGDVSNGVLDLSKNQLQTTLFKFFASKNNNSSTHVVSRDPSSSRKAAVASKANPAKAAWDKVFEKASEKNEGYYDRVFREAGVKAPGESKCPFCKRIPETSFCVDAFRTGAIPGMTSYFLSHFHSDHYGGLNRRFEQPIFCSKVTANLVVRMLAVSRQWVNALPLNEMCVIKGVKVTLLDANHCPGSVMFLFETASGQRYLHTGDCRYTPTFLPLPPIDILFLDTTYCRPEYAFPPQDEVISEALKLARRDALFVCGSYNLGKERLFVALSHLLNANIYVSKQKRIVLDCLEDKDLVQHLRSDPSQCQIHVVPMGHLKEQFIRQRLASAPRYSRVIALRPTGWTHTSKQSPVHLQWERGPVSLYGVAYSEHSSFSELKEFVQQVRPGKVVATVGSYASVKHWFQEWLTSR